MTDRLAKLLKRALWVEALWEAYPNRFTLWLWKRAVDRLRQERDAPPPKPVNSPLYGGLLSGLMSANAAKAAARAAQQNSQLAIQHYQNQMQQAAFNTCRSSQRLALGFHDWAPRR